jgi:hypothetical protein
MSGKKLQSLFGVSISPDFLPLLSPTHPVLPQIAQRIGFAFHHHVSPVIPA